jgi:hypothetical protein
MWQGVALCLGAAHHHHRLPKNFSPATLRTLPVKNEFAGMALLAASDDDLKLRRMM